MQIHLGYAPGIGKAGFEQSQEFKEGIWRRIGRNREGAFLKTVHHEEQTGIVVDYDSEVEGAQEWALKAERLVEDVWKEIREAREVGCRIVSRVQP